MLLGRVENPGTFTKIQVRKTDGRPLLRERNRRQEKRTNPHVFTFWQKRVQLASKKMRPRPATVGRSGHLECAGHLQRPKFALTDTAGG